VASRATPTGLLVLATHGRSRWDRLRLGSVTAATIREAPVPVLVVPAGTPTRAATT
jgi:nucleotide-binding universal stress UspA family protein